MGAGEGGKVGRDGLGPEEFLQRHDAGGVVVEEVDGVGAVEEVDGVGFWGAWAEAFDVAAGG